MRVADAVKLIEQRFISRTDTYSEQWFNEEKGAGYRRVTMGFCPNKPPCPRYACEHIQSVPLTAKDIAQHLRGERTLGIYQLTEDNKVKWACIDVDIAKKAEGDDLPEKVKQQTLAAVRQLARIDQRILQALIVEDSGNRGYHIWIFFEPLVQARYALALVEGVLSKIPAVEGITYEYFPKQTMLHSFGNLMKLPLGIHLKSNRRCLFVNHHFEPVADQMARLQQVQPLTEDELIAIITEHGFEIPSSVRLEPAGQEGKTGRTGLPCMSRMMSEGFSSGSRDVGMFRVGCFLRDRGIPYDLAVPLFDALNEKNAPPLDSYNLSSKLDSAYKGDYSVFPCDESSLDSYCSSKCRFWDGKLRSRWRPYNRPDSEAVGNISRD